ncbi:MAG: sugar transferase, partial [Lachnospiraceae bacterium]|nr:sugar transferase [Lachnospiraceae bacterium]
RSDELPQGWPSRQGDLSRVGTRPPTVDEFEQYESHHKVRLSFKPGLTGMWQVSGRSDITDFEEVVRLDEEYIATWNLWLDIKILLKTVVVVLKRKGSE